MLGLNAVRAQVHGRDVTAQPNFADHHDRAAQFVLFLLDALQRGHRDGVRDEPLERLAEAEFLWSDVHDQHLIVQTGWRLWRHAVQCRARRAGARRQCGTIRREHFSILKGMEEVTPQEGQRRVQQGAVLLDVREDNEYREVRAQGAQLMPLSMFEESFQQLPKDQEIVVICRSGARSARAAQYLLDRGFNAVNLQGGTIAWEEQGLPVERGQQ